MYHSRPTPQSPPSPPLQAEYPMHRQPAVQTSNMENKEQPLLSGQLSFVLNISHNITQLCIGGAVFSAFIIPIFLADALFFLAHQSLGTHIFLCTIGYLLMMTQGVLAFSPFGWAIHLKYEIRKLLHLGLQVIGSILVIIGTVIQMANAHNNFSTAHGVFGILAMVLTIIGCGGGFLGLLFPDKMNHKIVKVSHAAVGGATLCFAFISLMIAFDSNFFRASLGESIANLSIVLSVFALVGTLITACVINVKRLLN